MSVYMPTTVDEAVALLVDNPGARLLTGGTDTMVEVNFNHLKPETVIGLRRVASLREFTITPQRIDIGAGVPYARMETGPLAEALPALAAAARTVGSPQIRAAGTLGGNLGTCSPAGDGLPVLAALDAVVNLRSPRGIRAVPFQEFMVGVKRNSRHADEIIESVSITPTTGYQDYAKVGVRNAMVISVASVCLVHDRTTASVRIALGAVGPTIIRAGEAETWLAAQVDASTTLPPDDGIATEFARRVAAEARPIDDHRSTAAYRRHAIQTLARRLYLRSTK
ncbi:MAG: FAD binding domain-containing protein [Actinomycetota bacterium]